MSNSYFSGLGVFLVDTLVSLYVFALMLRLENLNKTILG